MAHGSIVNLPAPAVDQCGSYAVFPSRLRLGQAPAINLGDQTALELLVVTLILFLHLSDSFPGIFPIIGQAH